MTSRFFIFSLGCCAFGFSCGGRDGDIPIDAHTDVALDTASDAPIDAPNDIALDSPSSGGCTDDEECVRDDGRAWGCERGDCVPRDCLPGRADCDDVPDCETPLGTLSDCAACGDVCEALPNASVMCAESCAFESCDEGFADCDEDAENGCEIELGTIENCTACGETCEALPNARPACDEAGCGLGECLEGFADCDGDPSNGCEVSLVDNDLNCGACGVACNPSGASGRCAGTTCEIVACDSGRGDCNGDASDGCEAVSGSAATCARDACSLGVECAAGQVCAPGLEGFSCDPACPAGRTNCEGTCSNLDRDPLNCGTCGNVCPEPFGAFPVCSLGACTLHCDIDRADCNADESDGCETSLNSDEHCGRCGAGCVEGETCIDQVCTRL